MRRFVFSTALASVIFVAVSQPSWAVDVATAHGAPVRLEVAQALEQVLAGSAETQRPVPDVGRLAKAEKLGLS